MVINPTIIVYPIGGLSVYDGAQRQGKCINFGMLPVRVRFGGGWRDGETDVPERSMEKLFALAGGSEGVVNFGVAKIYDGVLFFWTLGGSVNRRNLQLPQEHGIFVFLYRYEYKKGPLA